VQGVIYLDKLTMRRPTIPERLRNVSCIGAIQSDITFTITFTCYAPAQGALSDDAV